MKNFFSIFTKQLIELNKFQMHAIQNSKNWLSVKRVTIWQRLISKFGCFQPVFLCQMDCHIIKSADLDGYTQTNLTNF